MNKKLSFSGAFLLLVVLLCVFPARSRYYDRLGNGIVADTLYPPEIEVVPSELHLDFKQGDFIIKDITILNRGGQPLEIYGMRGSCYCANAAIIHSYIVPFSKGTIRLSVNTKNLSDSLQRIDYTIRTNTPDSQKSYRVFLRLLPSDSDSSKNN